MHLRALALVAFLSGSAAMGTGPATAAPLSFGGFSPATASTQSQNSLVIKVQRRRRGGISPGAAAAIGVIGAIGTAIAIDSARRGAAAAEVDDDAVEYCLRRYKSYDVESGTYMGFDGYRHPCP
jgi:BA14K-like protein